MVVVEQPSSTVAASVGSILREARERAGISLQDVSQRTLIPLIRLRALENEDYAQVGATTFVLGYTRSYARFLGLDPQPLLRDLEKILPKPDPLMTETPPVALALQVQRRPRSLFWPALIILVILVALVAYVGVTSSSLLSSPTVITPSSVSIREPDEPAARVLPLAVRLMNDSQRETNEAVSLAADDNLSDSDFSSSEVTDSSQSSSTDLPQMLSTEQSERLPAPVASATDELTLSFNGDCWVSVKDATGKAIIARQATSSDNLRLFGQAPFEVVLGDATAVASLTLNGQTIDTTPSPGRKTRRLTVGE